MEKQDIQRLIREARMIAPRLKLDPMTGMPEVLVTPSTDADYKKYAYPIFGLDDSGKLIIPTSASVIIAEVRKALTKATLQKLATAVRYVAVNQLRIILDELEDMEARNQSTTVAKILTHPKFKAILELAAMFPAEYQDNWHPVRPRVGKKNSAKGLMDDWVDQLVLTFDGQYRIPATVIALTGARPAELETGVLLHRDGDQLFARISGAKVTNHAGQETRILQINHHLKSILLKYMDHQEDPSRVLVQVLKGNSITTHIRAKASMLFKGHKQAITSYTFRHAIASAAKKLVSEKGADPESVSMILGHRVDKTASFYGHQSKSGSGSMAPTPLSTTHPVKRKLLPRNMARRNQGLMPMRRRKLRRNK